MADMTTIKGLIAETIYPNGTGSITAESHQALLLEMVDDINARKADQSELIATQENLDALEQKVDNLPKGEEFDAEGNYPSLRVGTADTAIDLAGRGESVPASFGFRASGGKSIKDGRAYIKRLKGNSVVWNQQSSGELLGGDNGTTKALPQGARIVQGHKYLILCDKVVNSELYLYYNDGEGKSLTYLNAVSYKFIESSISFTANGQANTEGGIWWYLTNASANDARPRLIDLTQMFQAGNEPSTIEEYYARKPIVEDEYAYNEGQVIHCNTESIKSVGDNAWDEEWELGTFNTTTGEDITRTDQIRSKNLIKILPNEQYHFGGNGEMWIIFYDANKNVIDSPSGASSGNSIYKAAGNRFTTPSNAAFMKFYLLSNYGTTYNHDIMITLVHSGWKQDTDAGYQPYWQDILPLPIIRKYFPDGMKSAGSAHDEIRFNKANGKWEAVQRIGSVDMSQFRWYQGACFWASYNSYEFMSDMKKPTGNGKVANICCKKYIAGSWTSVYEGTEGNIAMYSVDGRIGIVDSSLQTEADVRAAMQGVILYYELAEPIVTELDAEDQNFRDYYQVADFGTEEAIPATDAEGNIIPSAPFSADIIYQFNAVDMIREHELEIAELQKVIATMQAQLTSLTNGVA